MSLNKKEFESTINLNLKKRYSYFIKKIADYEEVWSLSNEKGWVTSEDEDGRIQLHFWPTEEHAAYCAIDKWEGTVPEAIELEDFIEAWIPGMKSDGVGVSIFYNNENSISVDVQKLKGDIEEELKNY
ncbi:DUF2750 domain-containing protein [Bacillus safensis]|uniref:DUF2750 domain-containing protein n=1 Tax=Bacillus safensis TaxID=561879 RepID=UPI0018CD72AD|nr:DUF2750 domain-containing protein [Bacillus safensis]MBG9818389.1 hypothetical protein [Bacillus safensis]